MDASYPPPSSPLPQKKKSYTWIVVVATSVLVVASFFIVRALRPAEVGEMKLQTTNLPGLTLDLPGGKVVKQSDDRDSGHYTVRQLGLKMTTVSVGWGPGDGMDEAEARDVAKSFVSGMDSDNGDVGDVHERQVGGHDGWITVGHGGMLATATISWYCPEEHRVIHVLLATNAGADQVSQLAERVADSVHCHVAGEPSAGTEPAAP